MNAIVKSETRGEIMESVLIRGDLSKLTVEERGSYYTAVCTSIGLNPLTKPFEYITLNGKLRLYALKDCTDQLRSIHGISVTELLESEREGVFVVKAKVANAAGRTDISTGAVNIAGLKGENLANALMKAETKAKRRATLSICGLGLLDETEVEDIPMAQKGPVERPRVPSPSPATPEPEIAPEPPQGPLEPHLIAGDDYTAKTWSEAYIAAMQTSPDTATVFKWVDANAVQLKKLGKALFAKVEAATKDHQDKLRVVQSTMPDIATAYEDWIKWAVATISATDAGDDMDALFESFDPFWGDIAPFDKDLLAKARRGREEAMEP